MSDITREDAVKWLTNLREDCGRYQDLWHYAEALDQIIKLLSADVAPVRHGRWEREFGAYLGSYPRFVYHCSICGHAEEHAYADSKCSNYCPNCGAKMDGGDCSGR